LMIDQMVGTSMWRNEATWSENLMDQSQPAASTGNVLFQGDDFQGASVFTITTTSHSLYPKPQQQ
jgi:hypothetical protein